MDNKIVLNIPELMKLLGISRTTAYELVSREDFPSARLGKRIVVPVEGLNAWLAKGGTEQKGA